MFMMVLGFLSPHDNAQEKEISDAQNSWTKGRGHPVCVVFGQKVNFHGQKTPPRRVLGFERKTFLNSCVHSFFRLPRRFRHVCTTFIHLSVCQVMDIGLKTWWYWTYSAVPPFNACVRVIDWLALDIARRLTGDLTAHKKTCKVDRTRLFFKLYSKVWLSKGPAWRDANSHSVK